MCGLFASSDRRSSPFIASHMHTRSHQTELSWLFRSSCSGVAMTRGPSSNDDSDPVSREVVEMLGALVEALAAWTERLEALRYLLAREIGRVRRSPTRLANCVLTEIFRSRQSATRWQRHWTRSQHSPA